MSIEDMLADLGCESVTAAATVDQAVALIEAHGITGFNQDDEQNPPAKVAELKKRVRDADALLFVTPEYNYSVPGVLKNAIDWASRPYGDSAWMANPPRSWALRSELSPLRARNIIYARCSCF
jgi:NAD(P)H-dependent FMN reductase